MRPAIEHSVGSGCGFFLSSSCEVIQEMYGLTVFKELKTIFQRGQKESTERLDASPTVT